MSEQADVSSAEFAILLFRRSRETPARRHPSAEQEEVERKLWLEKMKNGQLDNSLESQLAGSEKAVYGLLSDQPTTFDKLKVNTDLDTGILTSALMMLELAGLARRSGDQYVRHASNLNGVREILDDDTAQIVADFLDYVRIIFHGISRKNLQLYLAAYWCDVDGRRWQPGALLHACIQSRPISGREILAFVSQPVVKIPRQRYLQAA